MGEPFSRTLEVWANFHVIVGSSAAALTGLQFVVLTLITQSGVRGGAESIAAFGSPNVVHFCAALLVAAVLSVPWPGWIEPAMAIAACGVAGVVYCAMVLQRARRQSGYRPVLEDWIWHNVLPTLAYLALLIAGTLLAWQSTGALFVIAGAELLLVFIGIHNAWDTVTYLTLQAARTADADVAATAPATGEADPGRSPALHPAAERSPSAGPS